MQHIKGDPHRTVQRPKDRAKPMQPVGVEPDTRLAAFSARGQHPVNSRHHQPIDKVGARVCAMSATSVADRMVEGVELPEKEFAVAVQWHPEDQVQRDEAQVEALSRPSRTAVGKRGTDGQIETTFQSLFQVL